MVRPIMKWPGGKRSELAAILQAMPAKMERYIEPFVGGGAVWLGLPEASAYSVNDASHELMAVYGHVKAQTPEFFAHLETLDCLWRGVEVALSRRWPALAEVWLAVGGKVSGEREVVRDHEAVRDCGDKGVSNLEGGRAGPKALEEQVARALELDGGPGWLSDLGVGVLDGEQLAHAIVASVHAKLVRMGRLQAKQGRLPEADVLANILAGVKGGIYTAVRAEHNRLVAQGAGAMPGGAVPGDPVPGGALPGSITQANALPVVAGLDSVNDMAGQALYGPRGSALYYFVRQYCYSSMFRYNKAGQFNVPYGGISYNQQYLAPAIARMHEEALVERLEHTTLSSVDFEEHLAAQDPQPGDVIFIDPPYDTTFSAYGGRAFGEEDHIRLRDACARSKANVMIVIKHTPFIEALYKDFLVHTFDTRYRVSFMDRNDRRAEHLMITNYQP